MDGFKGVTVTCPRWHNWINFRYLCKSWILTLANLDDGGPTILSVIYPCSLQPGPGFIPVVSLLILDSWAQVLQIFPYSTSFLFHLFDDPPVLSSLNKFESHKGPNSSTTPIAFLGLLIATTMAINKTAIETFIHKISICGDLRKGSPFRQAGEGEERMLSCPTQIVYNLNGDNPIKCGNRMTLFKTMVTQTTRTGRIKSEGKLFPPPTRVSKTSRRERMEPGYPP